MKECQNKQRYHGFMKPGKDRFKWLYFARALICLLLRLRRRIRFLAHLALIYNHDYSSIRQRTVSNDFNTSPFIIPKPT